MQELDVQCKVIFPCVICVLSLVHLAPTRVTCTSWSVGTCAIYRKGVNLTFSKWFLFIHSNIQLLYSYCFLNKYKST